MPRLSMTLTDRGALSEGIQKRVSIFEAEVNGARQRAAKTATTVSKNSFKRKRDLAAPRPGRSGKGQLVSSLRWRPIGTGAGVGLALSELNAAAPHWIIQEIGTGQKAIQRVAGKPNPRGRPAKGARYVKTVRSQVGRRISPGLVFATKGGQYSAPGTATGQQLYLASRVTGAPARYNPRTQRSRAAIRISKEIRGQHFVQKGGNAGFHEYQTSVLAAARSQFRKAKR